MTPTIALVLVALLVAVLTLFKVLRQKAEGTNKAAQFEGASLSHHNIFYKDFSRSSGSFSLKNDLNSGEFANLTSSHRDWTYSHPRSEWQRMALHLGQSALCGLLVWVINLLGGWGPVREVDAIFSGLGVLVCAGLGFGLLSLVGLYLEEVLGLFGWLLPEKVSARTRPRRKARPQPKRDSSSPNKLEVAALPHPGKAGRLDWCPECLRWHSAQANHEHSNLAG